MKQVPVRCGCGNSWFVGPDLIGGLTNCPRCGKATQVEGLRDPFWRFLQLGAVIVWVLAVSLLYTNVGIGWAVGIGLMLAAVYGLICIAL